MRNRHFAWFVPLVVLVLAACGPDLTTAPGLLPSTQTGSRTVVVDSLRMSLIGDAATAIQSGTFRFTLNGEPEQIQPGNVIVGVQDGGFLRRVTTVTREGNMLVLRTTQADLAEALGQQSFDRSIEIPLGAATGPAAPAGARYSLGAVQVENLAPGITLAETGLSLNNVTLFNAPFCAAGQTRNCPQVRVGISNGWIGLKSTLDMGASLGWTGVNSAYVRLDGTASFSMNGYAEFTGPARNVAWSRSLGAASRPFVIWVGVVPISGKVTIDLLAQATLDVNTTTRVNAGFNSSAQATVGAQWTRAAGYQRLTGVSAQASALPVGFSGYPQAGVRIGITPRVTVSVYGIPGDSYAGIKPYLAAQVRGDPQRRVAPYTLSWGVDAEAGVNFKVFSKSLGSWNYNTNLYNRVLVSR